VASAGAPAASSATATLGAHVAIHSENSAPACGTPASVAKST